MFAALSSVVFFGFMMALYVLGFGVHQWDITYVNLESLISKVLGSTLLQRRASVLTSLAE
ncbi:MAG: hypothetical protein Q9177_003383 [Variospora cf. flavescens]